MAKCEICNKSVSFGKKISTSRSHVSGRANHMQKPNVRKVKMDMDGTVKSMNVCTRCLRTNRSNRITG